MFSFNLNTTEVRLLSMALNTQLQPTALGAVCACVCVCVRACVRSFVRSWIGVMQSRCGNFSVNPAGHGNPARWET